MNLGIYPFLSVKGAKYYDDSSILILEVIMHEQELQNASGMGRIAHRIYHIQYQLCRASQKA